VLQQKLFIQNLAVIMNPTCKQLLDCLIKTKSLSVDEYEFLLKNFSESDFNFAIKSAKEKCEKHYGSKIFLRGLIEFSNYCKNNCFYCGIRCENKKLNRYRMTKEEILQCCQNGYNLELKTFVLQSGEDSFFTDEILCDIVSEIKHNFPSCAITLSVGEKSFDSYKLLKNAGTDRFLLRHETADENHYSFLHPKNMSFENRMKCIENLQNLGFQLGIGMMVGSPKQTTKTLAKDLSFIQRIQPQMVGIGPFISHKDTPFAKEPNGSINLTLFLIALIRLILPKALIPSTTALATLTSQGRIQGLLAGANVLMPNLTSEKGRDYSLYNNKLRTGLENVNGLKELSENLNKHGFSISYDRGDSLIPVKN